jgi:hypothetical protein
MAQLTRGWRCRGCVRQCLSDCGTNLGHADGQPAGLPITPGPAAPSLSERPCQHHHGRQESCVASPTQTQALTQLTLVLIEFNIHAHPLSCCCPAASSLNSHWYIIGRKRQPTGGACTQQQWAANTPQPAHHALIGTAAAGAPSPAP